MVAPPARDADARLFPRGEQIRPPLLALPRGPLRPRDERAEMVRAWRVCVKEDRPVCGRNFPCSALFFDMGFGADMRLKPMAQGFPARAARQVFSTPLLMPLIAGRSRCTQNSR